MTNVSSSTLAGASLQAYGFAGRSSAESEQKLPLKGNDCECETENKKLAKNAALQTPTVPLISPSAVLELQAQDEAEAGATGKADDGAYGGAGNSGQNEQAASGADPAASSGQNANPADQSGGAPEGDSGTQGDGLSDGEEKQVDKLKQRDREVRAHEQAHARVGGAYAGSASYSYQQGPDGKRYAIGGEVSIDTSSERTAEATARKMQVVIRAATAPAEPSSQDLKVAQQARAALAEAQAQIREEKQQELQGGEDSGGAGQSASGEADDDGSNNASNSRSRDAGSGNGSPASQIQQASSAYQKAAEQVFAAAARDSQGLFGSSVYA